MILLFLLALLISPAWAQGAALQSTALGLPGGDKGMRLDDIHFARDLGKVLVPAGQTGKMYLIDPATGAMASIDGFTSSTEDKKGHHSGVTSADEGEGYIFTGDHGSKQLDVVDEKTGKIVASSALMFDPDIIRYVPLNHEIWVTEPDGDRKQIQIFGFNKTYLGVHVSLVSLPPLASLLLLTFPDGPESLTIDSAHQRAYTNLGAKTAVIDLKSHALIAKWPNDCKDSSGTAVDEARGFVFVACKEGKTLVFDQNGRQTGSSTTGPGIDLIDYNQASSHLYVTGSKNATLSVLGVSSKGELSLLGVSPAVKRGHCVTGDNQNSIWVCDPLHGQLLRYKDTYPAAKS